MIGTECKTSPIKFQDMGTPQANFNCVKESDYKEWEGDQYEGGCEELFNEN